MLAEATFQGYIRYNQTNQKQRYDNEGNPLPLVPSIVGTLSILTSTNLDSKYYHNIYICAKGDVAEHIMKNYPLNYDINGRSDNSINYEVVVQCSLNVVRYKKYGKWKVMPQWYINKIYPCAITREDIQELTGYVKEEKIISGGFNTIEDLGTDNDWGDD